MTIFEIGTPVFGAIAITLHLMSDFGDKAKAKERKDASVYCMCMALIGMAGIASSDHRKLERRVETIEKSNGIER